MTSSQKKIKCTYFGDTIQCEPVEPGSPIHHDYSRPETVLRMCGDKNELKYINGNSRYNKKQQQYIKYWIS